MIVSFDTETTGVSPVDDELLQITIVDDKENILLESYIKPAFRTSWKNAQQVNRINPKDIQDAPTAIELAPKIKEIFDQADVICGYNVGFDVDFVTRCCNIKIDKTKVVDCLKKFRDESKKLGLDLPHHKLGNAVDFYCPQAKKDYLENAHDASCDAIATMRVYKAQMQDIPRFYEKNKQVSQNTMDFLNSFFDKQKKEEKTSEDLESPFELS